MILDRIVLPETVAEAIFAAARAAAPREMCGALLGRRRGGCGRVERFVEWENLWPAPGGYLVANGVRAETARAAAAEGREILAEVHSHPDDLPIPSGLDIEGAAARSAGADGCHIAIAALSPVAAVRAYYLFDGRDVPVPVEIDRRGAGLRTAPPLPSCGP